MPITNEWKSDNYKFVGKAFDTAYDNRLNKLLPIIGEEKTNSIDYEMTGTEGYGELERYDGANLNKGTAKRGFKTVIRPEFANPEAISGCRECGMCVSACPTGALGFTV